MSKVTLVADRLEKPELDDRSYRVIKLGNELEALLVHDQDTDKASASANVNVGNFSDDDAMPGMAHAVEVSPSSSPPLPCPVFLLLIKKKRMRDEYFLPKNEIYLSIDMGGCDSSIYYLWERKRSV